MRILIVEDEVLAVERLTILLKQYDPTIKIEACVESIEEAVQWLKTKPHPDLMLMDIQLSDGHSFEIFKQVHLTVPVIFTTAYDNFAITAFKHFSLDYILKPVTATDLAAAMQKYALISQAFAPPDYGRWAESLKQNTTVYKDRFLAKVGSRSFFIQVEEVAYFYAENKIVYLVDQEGNRFIINATMEKLEPMLDPHLFFRVNRKMIVHSKMIDLIKPYYNNRLKLNLKKVKLSEEIIISRERVCAFKKWVEN